MPYPLPTYFCLFAIFHQLPIHQYTRRAIAPILPNSINNNTRPLSSFCYNPSTSLLPTHKYTIMPIVLNSFNNHTLIWSDLLYPRNTYNFSFYFISIGNTTIGTNNLVSVNPSSPRHLGTRSSTRICLRIPLLLHFSSSQIWRSNLVRIMSDGF